MFPGFDPQALLAQAQAMQQQIADAQAALEDERIDGSAGGGLVVATVSGTGELLAVQIDSEVVDPEDVDTLADLFVAAVRDAQRQAMRVAASMTPGAGLDLGSLDLSALSFPASPDPQADDATVVSDARDTPPLGG